MRKFQKLFSDYLVQVFIVWCVNVAIFSITVSEGYGGREMGVLQQWWAASSSRIPLHIRDTTTLNTKEIFHEAEKVIDGRLLMSRKTRICNKTVFKIIILPSSIITLYQTPSLSRQT